MIPAPVPPASAFEKLSADPGSQCVPGHVRDLMLGVDV